jgi:Helitron helicase-like domain at N-terminus
MLPQLTKLPCFFLETKTNTVNRRDVVLHGRDGNLDFIHDHHRAYVPLHYVLLFSHGTDGWTYGLPHVPNTSQRNRFITQAQYYFHRLHTRQEQFPTLQSGGRLFQQYVCDMWTSTDQNRLRWVKSNQINLNFVPLFTAGW